VETLLTYLELDGILASTGPFYNEYKFQPQRSSAEILARFDADRAAFLRKILSRAKKASTWFHLDLHAASQAIGEPRERIITALNYLEEQGDLVLRVAGVRQGYRLLITKVDRQELCASLMKRFQERESRDIARVKRVVELAGHQGCTTGFLLNYFGEKHADCGHCGWCLGERPSPLAAAVERKFTKADGQLVAELRGENHAALAASRQLARFLCGLASPATTRAKLNRDSRFGRLAGAPFGEVLKFVERS
jgi:ATP-dependent DNA helicase RecQ